MGLTKCGILHQASSSRASLDTEVEEVHYANIDDLEIEEAELQRKEPPPWEEATQPSRPPPRIQTWEAFDAVTDGVDHMELGLQ